MAQIAPTQATPLYRRPIVEQVTGYSRTGIYRRVKAGTFTKPVKIGANSVAWPENEIIALNKAIIAGKSDDEIKVLVAELHAARG